MSKRILGLFIAVFGLVAAWTVPVLSAPAPAPANADSALAMVPAKAPIIVQVHGYERAKQRLGGFLSNSLPDLAPKITQKIDEGIKELLEGRETKSFSKDGHLFVIINDLDGIAENPQGAILVPVADYASFRDSFLTATERKTVKKEDDGYYSVKPDKLDDSIYMVDRKSAVLLTKEKDLAKFFAAADYPTLDASIGKGTAKAFLDSDAAVYVNLKEVNKKYGTQIKGFKTVIDFALGAGGQGLDKKQIELVKQLIGGLLQLVEDSEAFVMGFEFREEGANLKLQAQFSDKTETNDFLKNFKPAALSQLATMPAGQLFYTATNFDASKSKMLSKLVTEMLANDEDEDAKKAIDAALQELTEQSSTIQLSSSSAENMMRSGLEIQEFADAKKVAAAHLKLFKALTKTSTFGNTPLKEKPVVKEAVETVGNFKLHSASLTFDLEKALAEIPENLKEGTKVTLTKMYGDGLKLWFGTDGKRYVQLTAKDFPEAKALLEEYLDGKKTLEQDESFRATRKQLPADATFLTVGDASRFVQAMFELMKDSLAAVPGFPAGGLPAVKAPKGKPAYFGMAIALKPEYGSFDLFVPTTAVQQIRKMFAPLLNDDN